MKQKNTSNKPLPPIVQHLGQALEYEIEQKRQLNDTIYGLSNFDYHHSSPYNEYLSSSQIKKYLISPKSFKYALDNPQETESHFQSFGLLFHSYMEYAARYSSDPDSAEVQWLRDIVVFKVPINKRTGIPYGINTKTYKEAIEAFMQANKDKMVASEEDIALVQDLGSSLIGYCDSTSEQTRKLLRWGKSEVSFFCETKDGIKLKARPDLLTRKKIIDFKTTRSDDLKENAINNTILKYGYQISAAMYQYVVHKVTGKWLDFILIFISKEPPHDCVMVDMANYGYRYLPESDMVIPGPGALEFKKLLDLHTKCTKENHWPGAETFIPSNNGIRILEIQPPIYYTNKITDDFQL